MNRLADAIIQFLTDFWPLKIVHTFQRGVLFKKGHAQPRHIMPGVYWIWPWVWSLEIISVVPDTESLTTQSITTSDEKSISFSVNIQFEILDAVAAYTKVHDYLSTMRSEAAIYLARHVRKHVFEEIIVNQDNIERNLGRRLTRKFSKWGIQINAVGLTNLVHAKQYRLFGDYRT